MDGSKDTQIHIDGWAQPVGIDIDALKAAGPTLPGSIAEADPEIEAQLYENKLNGIGEAMEALNLEVVFETEEPIDPLQSFKGADLHPVVLENIQKCGYKEPTAIQAHVIPALLKNLDIVAVSQTGSGKTAAYMIPIVSKFMGAVQKIGGPRVDTRMPNYDPEINKVCAEPLVVVVVPTRELAHQVLNECRRIAYRSKLLAVCCYGGIPVKYNLQQLGKGCDILIGTPGRLVDLIGRPDRLSMNRVQYTILDEADEMLNEDWKEELDKIMLGGNINQDWDRRFLMFSATFPKKSLELARTFMEEGYVHLSVGRAGSTHKNVTQDIVYVDDNKKREALRDLFMQHVIPVGSRVIIFVNYLGRVEELDDYLYNDLRLPTTFMHGKRSQYERDDAMRNFRLGIAKIMITTPVSARGLDFENVNVVVNYDLPSADHGGIREYVHRIGRTARIGHKGLAISFFNNDKNSDIAPDLTATLLEQGQTIPDFLEEHKPSNGTLVFTDDVDETDATGGDEGWGAPAGIDTGNANGWGASADENGGDADPGNEGGWGASKEEAGGAAVTTGSW